MTIIREERLLTLDVYKSQDWPMFRHLCLKHNENASKFEISAISYEVSALGQEIAQTNVDKICDKRICQELSVILSNNMGYRFLLFATSDLMADSAFNRHFRLWGIFRKKHILDKITPVSEIGESYPGHILYYGIGYLSSCDFISCLSVLRAYNRPSLILLRKSDDTLDMEKFTTEVFTAAFPNINNTKYNKPTLSIDWANACETLCRDGAIIIRLEEDVEMIRSYGQIFMSRETLVELGLS